MPWNPGYAFTDCFIRVGDRFRNLRTSALLLGPVVTELGNVLLSLLLRAWRLELPKFQAFFGAQKIPQPLVWVPKSTRE